MFCIRLLKLGLKPLFKPSTSRVQNIALGTLVGGITSSVLYPADAIITIMRARCLTYRESYDLYTRQSGLTMFSGFLPAVCGILVYRTTYFYVYDALVSHEDDNIFKKYLSSKLVSIISLLAVYPFDTISKIMILQRASGNPMGMIECIRLIYQTRGFQGFYSGIGISFAERIIMGYVAEAISNVFDEILSKINK